MWLYLPLNSRQVLAHLRGGLVAAFAVFFQGLADDSI
jgi:hypothetical protein